MHHCSSNTHTHTHTHKHTHTYYFQILKARSDILCEICEIESEAWRLWSWWDFLLVHCESVLSGLLTLTKSVCVTLAHLACLYRYSYDRFNLNSPRVIKTVLSFKVALSGSPACCNRLPFVCTLVSTPSIIKPVHLASLKIHPFIHLSIIIIQSFYLFFCHSIVLSFDHSVH